MELLTMLDVALGLTFIYLLFALIASATNEAIAALLSSRAKWLRRGIESLFQGKPLKEIEDNVEKLLSHPAMAHLSRRPGKRSGMEKLQRSWEASYLPSDALLHALVSSEPQATYPGSVPELRERILALPDQTPIRVALERLLNVDVDQTIEQFTERFDEWYLTFQKQISNWYRQKTHFMLWVISIVIAFAFNLDSILMVRALSVDESLRTELVLAAQTRLDQQTPTQETNGEDPENNLKAELARMQAQVLTLQTAGLPVGWTGTTADWRIVPTADSTESIGVIDWLFKLLGLFLTAAAMTLGAPFWFDLLKKVSSVRSTGTTLLKKTPSGEPKRSHV